LSNARKQTIKKIQTNGEEERELKTNLQWHEEDNEDSQKTRGSMRAETERKRSAKKKTSMKA